MDKRFIILSLLAVNALYRAGAAMAPYVPQENVQLVNNSSSMILPSTVGLSPVLAGQGMHEFEIKTLGILPEKSQIDQSVNAGDQLLSYKVLLPGQIVHNLPCFAQSRQMVRINQGYNRVEFFDGPQGVIARTYLSLFAKFGLFGTGFHQGLCLRVGPLRKLDRTNISLEQARYRDGGKIVGVLTTVSLLGGICAGLYRLLSGGARSASGVK